MVLKRHELEHATLRYLVRCFKRQTTPQVTELAALVGMKPSAFSRYFRRICGENPSIVLKRAQLQRARRHLAKGITVNRAAYGAGFGTRRSIYRAFRRVFGTTPRGQPERGPTG